MHLLVSTSQIVLKILTGSGESLRFYLSGLSYVLGSLPDIISYQAFFPFPFLVSLVLYGWAISPVLVSYFWDRLLSVIQAGLWLQATISGLHFLSTKAAGDDTSMVEEEFETLLRWWGKRCLSELQRLIYYREVKGLLSQLY